jgi:hypothetical protein
MLPRYFSLQTSLRGSCEAPLEVLHATLDLEYFLTSREWQGALKMYEC